ncbi:MAG: extracellular solute-binding protein [Alphaproteobacteria bacterium]
MLDWNDVSTERLVEAVKSGKMTRREMGQALASVGVAALGTTIMPKIAGAAVEDHPTVFTWSGYEDDGFMGAYMAKYDDEKPNFSFWGDEEEAFAKMRAGFKPDVTSPCSYKIPHWNDAGILAPIDSDRLSNWSDMIPTLTKVPGTIINGDRLWVCQDWGQTSITYRTDLVDIEEESWGLMWDERYAGRLSMIDSLIDGVMVAAIYGGAKDPYNMTTEEVAMAKDLLKKQLPLLRFYSNSMTDVEQALASGELVAAVTWNSSALELNNQGLPVRFMVPKEGAMTWTCGLSLMTDADPKKLDRSYAILDSYLSKESGYWEITEWGYGHANARAFDNVTEEQLAARGLSNDPDALINSGIFQEPIGNEPELQTMFEEVKAGF